ncbi:MAG TPA: phosphoribosylformylglycinamidine synthase subunit PurQ [Verrucomicrobiae bacterium]|nr:phosphoribosylformylglycinamidine synthase subunit PurQ [Verrucomicrobiae bacterium]
MKAAVVVFPGSNCDTDCYNVLKDVMGMKVEFVWHKDAALGEAELIVLPGGFSYGDYLRTGAVARFSRVMEAVKKHADQGKPVIGICNGFQILLEAGLLPGAMLRNLSLSFICKHVWLRVEDTNSIFTRHFKKGETISLPIAHGEGNYYCSDDTLKRLQDESRVAFRYSSKDGDVSAAFNPNGAKSNIAGILNEKRNVLGMMPHPERASEDVLGCDHGRKIWESILDVTMGSRT